MTATTEAAPRIVTLDVLRGVAVMGILAMNIIAFAMPFAAYQNYLAYGGDDATDLWSWILSTVFVDGKMRSMFSLLFGASMLLVIDRAEAAGESGSRVHVRRMLWLLVFGLIHFFFIWMGDILTGYALTGLIAFSFRRKTAKQLLKWSIIFFGIGLLLFALFFGSPYGLEAAANQPGASAEIVQKWQELEKNLGRPTPEMLEADIGRHQGGYAGIMGHKIREEALNPLIMTILFGPETLALMLLGMWGLRSGFLTGEWAAARYRKIASWNIGIGALAYGAIVWLTIRSGHSVGTTLALHGVVGAVFRPIMMVGYTALIVLLVKKAGASGPLFSRVAAAGRAAFTNYLGTSILMTALFYGYGGGLYGELDRAEIYLVVVAMWGLMLLWSKPWLDRYRYGPFEWLWRTLARGSRQPMLRKSPAPA
jgi:uncharacterized protein